MQEPKELNNKHRAVARYMALGLGLKEICDMFQLNHGTWQQITNTPLFKHEQERITSELEDRILEDAVKDPVIARIKAASLKAVNRLVEEIDAVGEESGATSSSRIKAAESILDRCGYNSKKEDHPTGAVFIPVTQDKLDAIFSKAGILPQPQSIQG